MRPQNQVEGTVPLLAVIVILATSLLSVQFAFGVAIASLVLLSLYLFIRKDW